MMSSYQMITMCLCALPPGTASVLSAEDDVVHSIHDIVMPLPGFDVIYPTHHGKLLPHFLDSTT